MLVAASAAHAQPMLVIDGAGDGHGVGMSQIGAEGLALHGYNYQQILAHYYTGTAITALPAMKTVTVLLESRRRSVSFSGGTLANSRRLGVAATYRAVAGHNGRIELENSHRRPIAGPSGTPPSGWDAACGGPTGAPAQGASGASGTSGTSGETGAT